MPNGNRRELSESIRSLNSFLPNDNHDKEDVESCIRRINGCRHDKATWLGHG